MPYSFKRLNAKTGEIENGFALSISNDWLAYKQLSDKEHMQIIDGQGNGKVIEWEDDATPYLAEPDPPTPEELAAQVRAERDAKIHAINWRLERYERQKAIGIATNDTDDWYKAALQYLQDLRDVPVQAGFPEHIQWPQEPKE